MRTLSIKAPGPKNEKKKMDIVVKLYTKHTNGELFTVDFVRSVEFLLVGDHGQQVLLYLT